MSDPAHWETAVLIGRCTNIVLAAVALSLMTTTVRGWKHRSAGNRFLWMAVGLAIFNSGFGTLEQMLQGVAGGWRIAITSVFLVWVIASLILKRRGQWYSNEYPSGLIGRSRGK